MAWVLLTNPPQIVDQVLELNENDWHVKRLIGDHIEFIRSNCLKIVHGSLQYLDVVNHYMDDIANLMNEIWAIPFDRFTEIQDIRGFIDSIENTVEKDS